ncbi:MAG: ABC transporter ATP-binding protein [Phycisphaerales bacterium]
MNRSSEVVLHGVAVGYGSRSVVAGVDARAEGGRLTALVGPNAAGKSTLMRVIAGLAPPIAGRVEIACRGMQGDPRAWGIRDRAAAIAVMPQQIRMPAGFSVGEIVAMGRHALPRSKARALKAIDRFGLGDLVDQAVHTLSVGQQQRVGLARVAAQHEPGGVIVLDEPFAALDLRELARAVSWLEACVADGAVAICSLHDLGFAARIADDAWLLDSGRLVGAGPATQVLSRGSLEGIFGSLATGLVLGAEAESG